MTSDPGNRSDQDLGLPIFCGRSGATAFALIAAVVLGASYATGVSQRAAAMREAASAAESEIRAFCLGMGLGEASDAYIHCLDGANDLRRWHQHRIQSELADL
jgi:hypothetical protein